jgi:hypothetical protein
VGLYPASRTAEAHMGAEIGRSPYLLTLCRRLRPSFPAASPDGIQGVGLFGLRQDVLSFYGCFFLHPPLDVLEPE